MIKPQSTANSMSRAVASRVAAAVRGDSMKGAVGANGQVLAQEPTGDFTDATVRFFTLDISQLDDTSVVLK